MSEMTLNYSLKHLNLTKEIIMYDAATELAFNEARLINYGISNEILSDDNLHEMSLCTQTHVSFNITAGITDKPVAINLYN